MIPLVNRNGPSDTILEMTIIDAERFRTAVHEVAHAFVTQLNGTQVRSLDIRSKTHGTANYGPVPGTDMRERMRIGAEMTVAGMLSELILAGVPPSSFASSLASVQEGHDCWEDIYRFRDCAKKAEVPEGTIIGASRAKLDLHWKAILEVAAELERRNFIDGLEAEILISDAIERQRDSG